MPDQQTAATRGQATMPARSNTGSSGRRPSQDFKTELVDLDRDMTRADLCEALQGLMFFCGERHMIRIDRDVRNYLLDALRRKI